MLKKFFVGGLIIAGAWIVLAAGNVVTQDVGNRSRGAAASAPASAPAAASAPATRPPEPTATPVPKPEPLKFTGSGQKASDIFTLRKGLAVFDSEHTGGTSNFIVYLLDAKGETVSLVANGIGNFSGSKAARIPADGSYLLNVSADGRWSISVSQP